MSDELWKASLDRYLTTEPDPYQWEGPRPDDEPDGPEPPDDDPRFWPDADEADV